MRSGERVLRPARRIFKGNLGGWQENGTKRGAKDAANVPYGGYEDRFLFIGRHKLPPGQLAGVAFQLQLGKGAHGLAGGKPRRQANIV